MVEHDMNMDVGQRNHVFTKKIQKTEITCALSSPPTLPPQTIKTTSCAHLANEPLKFELDFPY